MIHNHRAPRYKVLCKIDQTLLLSYAEPFLVQLLFHVTCGPPCNHVSFLLVSPRQKTAHAVPWSFIPVD